MPEHPVHQILQRQDDLLWHVMDSAALIQNNYESIWRATGAVL